MWIEIILINNLWSVFRLFFIHWNSYSMTIWWCWFINYLFIFFYRIKYWSSISCWISLFSWQSFWKFFVFVPTFITLLSLSFIHYISGNFINLIQSSIFSFLLIIKITNCSFNIEKFFSRFFFVHFIHYPFLYLLLYSFWF